MDFEGAQQYLKRFISYEKSRDVSMYADFDISRVTRFLDEWCVGWKNMKYFHVGGSKGKGTVCTLISNYLDASGEVVGLFLSPHIVSICERISVNGEAIDEESFSGLVGEFSEFVGEKGCDLTWFEILFVLSLNYFLACGCEYAVLEVGMGGRLDATNVVMPLVTVLTGVELEHSDVLGDSIEKIFEEKWGIKKNGVPMVCSSSLMELSDGRDCDFANGNEELAKLALNRAGIEVDEGIFDDVVANLKMIGRFDIRGNVVFDMAHTVGSMRRLLKKLYEKFPNVDFKFILGLLKDKDKDGILKVLGEENVAFVGEFSDLAMDGEDWKSVYEKKSRELKEDQVLVVTGSSYLVGAVLSLDYH